MQEGPPGNGEAKEWWRDARCHFAPLTIDHPLLCDRSDLAFAIEFLTSLPGLPAGASILDLCCGPGRYSVELALRGHRVVGLDILPGFIALARELARREAVELELLTGDMREIPFRERFDLALSLGTSFGFFDDEADDRRVIAGIARSLKRGGRFVLEMGNRDYVLSHFVARDWTRLEDGRIRILERRFDAARGRIDTQFEVVGGAGEVERWGHSWRAYTLTEILGMLRDAGLLIKRVAGGWRGEAYSVEAPRMVVVAARPPA